MKKYLILLAIVVLAIAVGVYYFLFARGSVCKNVVPEDAKAVMIFDSKELLKQMDFSFSDVMRLWKQHNNEDSNVGISFTTPMYGFISSDNYVCGVFALSDAEAFEKTIVGQEYTVESQRGFKWVSVKDVLLCFDSDKALVLGPVSRGETDRVRGQMMEWMKQGAHDVPMLNTIEDMKGILRLRISYGAIPDNIQSKYKALFWNVDLDKIFLNMAFNIKEKAIALSMKTDSEDEGYDKFVSKWNAFLCPIDGGDLKMPYEEPLALAAFNLDGEDMMKSQSTDPTFGMALEGLKTYFNVGKMLQAIDGNVAIAINDESTFYAGIEVDDDEFMKGAQGLESGMSALGIQCKKTGSESYTIESGDASVYLGVRDDILYLTSDYDAAKAGSKYSSFKDGSSLKSQADDKLFYLSIDLNKLAKSSFATSSFDAVETKLVLKYFDRLNASATDDNCLEIELTTKQKISDILKSEEEK